MRKLLRVLAAIQTWAAAATCSIVGLTVVLFGADANGRTLGFTFFGMAATAVVASVGGILWCLTCLTTPLPPALPAGSLARFGLRVLAQVQLGSGVLLAVGAAALASDGLLLRPRHGEGGLSALSVLFVALGLAGSGAILWCLVRLAYSDRTVDAAAAGLRRPDRYFLRGAAGFVAVTATVVMALSGAGLVWHVVGSGFSGYTGGLRAVTALGVVAVVTAGLVWCAPVIAFAPVPRPGRAGGRWLRVLAGAQLWLGAGLAVVCAAHISTHAGANPWPPNESVLIGAGVFLLAVGLSCVGGVLWCAVRVAYPVGIESQKAANTPSKPAG